MTFQTTTFKGARYLVKFPGEWSSENSYEAIEAVKHNAFTYISKQPVPAGVDISNTDFWLLWADPNAQMEELRQLVAGYVDEMADIVEDDEVKVYSGRGSLVKGSTITADWILVKLKRSKFAIAASNNVDNFTNPFDALSNPLTWLENHEEAFIAHNACYSGGTTNAAVQTGHYAMRYNGIDYVAGEDAPRLRPFLAIDTENQNVAWYAQNTILADIPSNYDYAFACSDLLIRNGALQTPTIETGFDAQRAIFGWDDDNWYIFYSEGRNLRNLGLSTRDAAEMLLEDYNVQNAVNLDGGGSCLLACNYPSAQQVNGFKSQTRIKGSKRVTSINLNYTHID